MSLITTQAVGLPFLQFFFDVSAKGNFKGPNQLFALLKVQRELQKLVLIHVALVLVPKPDKII